MVSHIFVNIFGNKIFSLVLVLLLCLCGTKANDTYGAFPVNMVADIHGTYLGGQYQAYVYISLDSCKALCNANLKCNSFFYNTRDHCGLYDSCLTGTEPSSNVGSNYRSYYRLQCRGLPSPEPTLEPTRVPTFEPTAKPTQEPTRVPTFEPTAKPTQEPTRVPTFEPTAKPTYVPSFAPTNQPTNNPDDISNYKFI